MSQPAFLYLEPRDGEAKNALVFWFDIWRYDDLLSKHFHEAFEGQIGSMILQTLGFANSFGGLRCTEVSYQSPFNVLRLPGVGQCLYNGDVKVRVDFLLDLVYVTDS